MLIMKSFRFKHFRQGYSSAKRKIPVMKEDRLNCATEKEIDIDNKDIKANCRQYLTSLGKKNMKKKETVLSNLDLLGANYEFCYYQTVQS